MMRACFKPHQRGKFAGGPTIWDTCVLRLAAWVAASQMGVACMYTEAHHGSLPAAPTEVGYDSSLRCPSPCTFFNHGPWEGANTPTKDTWDTSLVIVQTSCLAARM